ncbi:hypothetical protein PV11_07351 [Exophiala sideris]|uniref:Uncharacterized protein n=1 Tax=Exophiala sideris TaxID=1016849 RepID=A0A0D1WX92_9EURO|nr:hypothetical protein PV11_07351 [Exophiala sideris]
MSRGAPPPPTITINASSAPTPATTIGSIPVTAVAATPREKAQKPVLVKTCYLCDEQNPGDFSPTTKFLEACLLCSRWFCPIHKSETWDQVCNINHSSYYHECLVKAQKEMADQGKGGETKRSVAEMLINEGIYPSLGEREKAIFSTSPVTDDKIQELEQYRSLDAALEGTTKKGGQTVEERDIVGADIAV